MKVWTNHYRRVYGGEDRLVSKYFAKLDGEKIAPQGGLTQVCVSLPNGKYYFGHAFCSNKDNFNKKIGRNIALGRALKIAEQEGYRVDR